MHDADIGHTLILAWTGHRSLRNPEIVRAAVVETISLLARKPSLLTPASGTAAFSRVVAIGSAAIGADLLIAEACLAASIPISIVLPFSRERFERGASPAENARIDAICAAAASVREISGAEDDDDAYIAANELMLDYADALIAIIDPDHLQSGSGSKSVEAAAKLQGVLLIKIDANTGEVLWPDGSCPRSSSAPVDAPTSAHPSPDLKSIERLYRSFDAEATSHSRPFRKALLWVISLHLAAVAIAVSAMLLDGFFEMVAFSTVAAFIKVLALFAALLLVLWRSGKHILWLEARTRAELCRSFLSIWEMPRQGLSLSPFPTHSCEAFHRELSVSWLFASPPDAPRKEIIDRYLKGNGIKGHPNEEGRIVGQCNWMITQLESASRWTQLARRAAKYLTATALLSAIIAIPFMLHDHDSWQYSLSKGLSILLPLASAAVLSAATSYDYTRRADRYADLIGRLEHLKDRLKNVRSRDAQVRAVAETEWILITELAEWYSFARHAGAMH